MFFLRDTSDTQTVESSVSIPSGQLGYLPPLLTRLRRIGPAALFTSICCVVFSCLASPCRADVITYSWSGAAERGFDNDGYGFGGNRFFNTNDGTPWTLEVDVDVNAPDVDSLFNANGLASEFTATFIPVATRLFFDGVDGQATNAFISFFDSIDRIAFQADFTFGGDTGVFASTANVPSTTLDFAVTGDVLNPPPLFSATTTTSLSGTSATDISLRVFAGTAVTSTVVPEPGTIAGVSSLLLFGLGGVAFHRTSRRRMARD